VSVEPFLLVQRARQYNHIVMKVERIKNKVHIDEFNSLLTVYSMIRE